MADPKGVLPTGFGAGPKGVGKFNTLILSFDFYSFLALIFTGDPEDTRLRKVELTIKIPQIMRDRAKKEKCIKEVSQFSDCCKSSGLLMTFKCKGESDELKKCMDRW